MTALAALHRLHRACVVEGYVDLYQLLGPLHRRTDALRLHLGAAPAPLAALARLFLLSEEVRAAELDAIVPADDRKALAAAGLLVTTGDVVTSNGLLLLPIFGRLAFVPKAPRAGWLGEERMALIARVAPPATGRSLDLCTDTGAVALHLATARTAVVAIDDDPDALAIARLNVAMAGLADRVAVVEGELWLPMAGERFERITAAPATLPRPPGLTMARHGGADGTAVISRIVGALPRLLAPGGTAHLIGVALGGDSPDRVLDGFARRARELDLAMTWTFPGRIALAPARGAGSSGFDLLARACARGAGVTLDIARHALGAHLAAERAHYLYLFALAVSRDGDGFHVGRHYAAPDGFWFG